MSERRSTGISSHMGTIYQRGSAWRAQVRVRGHSLARTFDSHEEARIWVAQQEAKLLAGARAQRGEAAFMTPVDLFRRYAEEVSPKKKGARWEVIRLERFETYPVFGKALRDFGPEDVATWRDERLRLVKGSSVNRELNLLSGVFTTAIKEWRIGLRENPVRLVSRPANPKARRRRVSDAEVAAIAAKLGWDGTSPPATMSQWVAWAHALAVETAMRKGELLGLRWGVVNLPAAYARLEDTKNDDARDVPLSRRARALFALLPAGAPGAPVIPVQPGTMDTLFRRAVKEAGLLDLHFHDARREATTRIAPKVGNVLDLARITGHRDLKSLRIYYEPDATELAKKLD